MAFIGLESIEVRMRDAIAKGAVPTLEQVTGRELLSRFGFQRRGTYINSLIHNELERLKLSVVPDFVVTWVDNPIVIRLDNDAADSDGDTLRLIPRTVSDLWQQPTILL